MLTMITQQAMGSWKDDLYRPDFKGDLHEKVARAIFARRPDCFGKSWPVETDTQRRAYPHNPIAAVDLSYDYADVAIKTITAVTAAGLTAQENQANG